MKRFGLLIFCWLMLGFSAQPAIAPSVIAAVCTDFGNVTTGQIVRVQVLGDTTVVVLGINGDPDTVASVSEDGGAALAHRVSLNSGGSNASVEIWSTTPGASTGSTSITFLLNGGGTDVCACAFGYTGVAALGTTNTGVGSDYHFSISLITQDNNNWVVGGWGLHHGTMSADVGNFRGTAGGYGSAAIADNTVVSPGSCTVGVLNNDGSNGVVAALELRSTGGAPPAAAKRRIIAD